jgi:hypothetical protein
LQKEFSTDLDKFKEKLKLNEETKEKNAKEELSDQNALKASNVPRSKEYV